MILLVAVGTVLLAVTLVFAFARAVDGAGARSGLSSAERRRLTAGVALALILWLASLASLARIGFFAPGTSGPPRVLLGPLGASAILVLATRTPVFRRLLAGAPRAWPIALHTMRVPIELGLWGLYLAGRIPEQMTFEGRNFDVLVGLSAPVVAWLVARRRISTRLAVAWNLASLGLLANIVGIAVTSMPGPLHLPWPGPSNDILTKFPFVWLPGFFVPCALFGHVLSLRQLLHRSEPVAARGVGQAREAR